MKPTEFEVKAVAWMEFMLLLLGMYVHKFGHTTSAFEWAWGAGMIIFAPFFWFIIRKARKL